MKAAALLFLAIGSLLTQDVSGAVSTLATTAPPTFDFSKLTPTCSGQPGKDLTVTLPQVAGYYAVVVHPQCASPLLSSLGTNAVSTNCTDSKSNSVTLSLQPSNNAVRQFAGGQHFTEVRITCHVLDDRGLILNASVSVTVNDTAATPTPLTVQPSLSPLTLALVTSGAPGGVTSTSSPIQTVTLGQADIYLRISGGGGLFLLPKSCRGTTVSTPSKTYIFFSADASCTYDDEVLGKFDVRNPDIFHAPFYPFMFVSGEFITLTCEVLVCPDTTSGTCKSTLEKVNKCQPTDSVPQTRRRRRSADGQEPHTRVLEVTYAVVNPDPALQGHTAAGPCTAVSVPLLLAAVVSRWIL